MRIQKLYLLLVSSALLVLATPGCAHKQSAALKSKIATPPALAPAAKTQVQTEVAAKPSTAQAASAVNSDRTAELIAAVESEYQLGQKSYQDGHLEAAKENFDTAFNLLLSSSLDLHSDPRLEQEFDRVVEGIDGLELQALQQGDGFTEPK